MSSEVNSLAGWIIVGGGGTVLGSLGVAVIQTFGKRGRDRAEAADLSTSAASRVIERLEHENVRMREALIVLAQIIDVVIEDLPEEHEHKAVLRDALKAAKIASI